MRTFLWLPLLLAGLGDGFTLLRAQPERAHCRGDGEQRVLATPGGEDGCKLQAISRRSSHSAMWAASISPSCPRGSEAALAPCALGIARPQPT